MQREEKENKRKVFSKKTIVYTIVYSTPVIGQQSKLIQPKTLLDAKYKKDVKLSVQDSNDPESNDFFYLI